MSLPSRLRDLLWVEKYRPKQIKDCILPQHIKRQFEEVVRTRELQNYIFVGHHGTGKTTLVSCLINELDAEVKFINGSSEGNIDSLRGTIAGFASKIARNHRQKIVVLDEGDGMSLAMQTGLRAFLEAYSGNVRFIITANYLSKIIEPLQSRCVVVNFLPFEDDLRPIKNAIYMRAVEILKENQIEFDKGAVVEYIVKTFPDIRKVLNELQAYAKSCGKIDSGILLSGDFDMESLFKVLKDKDFEGIKNWFVVHDKTDLSGLYTRLFESLDQYMQPESIPSAVLIIREGMRDHPNAIDKMIVGLAMCVELSCNCSYL